MSDPIGSDYSDAYEKIIGKDVRNLSSMIAYAIYKGQKREFIIRNNLKSDDPAISNYHKDLNSMRIDGLKMEADTLLERYSLAIEEELSELDRQEAIEHEIVKSVSDHVSSELTNLKTVITESTSAWKNIGYSVAGSFVFGVILTAAILLRGANPFAPWLEKTDPSVASQPAIPPANTNPPLLEQPKTP